MKKKILLTLLLALVVVAGQAQQKSGLNLCLRDEATGEWLVGLFDEYAIYDCDYWSYAEVGKGRLVLTHDKQHKEIRLKKGSVAIDGVKHKTSVLTTRFLPDYPVADDTPFDATILDKEQQATLRVAHRSGKAGIDVTTNFGSMVDDVLQSYASLSDSLGRYEAQIPLVGQTGSMMVTQATPAIYRLNNWIWIPYVIAPGEKMLFFVDDVEGRIYVMGKSARMVNEFLNHPLYGYDMDYDARKAMHFPQFISAYDKELQAFAHCRDSILSRHPLLSKRYKDYTESMSRSFFAYDLGQLRFNRGKVKREEIIGEAKRRRLFHFDAPFMVQKRYGRFLDDLCAAAIQKHCAIGSGVPFLQGILKKASEGGCWLSEEEKRLIESEMPAEAAIDVPSLQLLDSAGVWMEGFYLTDTLQALFESRPELFSEISLYYKQRQIQALDSLLDLPPTLREIAVARLIEKRLKEKVAPLDDNEMRMLRENVRQPYLLSAVLKTNDQLVAARKATEAIVTPDPRPLADLTDGEEIFRKIVEPYRGRFIYLDVWGTWCAPCKEMMTHVPKMKQQLKDLNIVYLYLVNHSNEQAWKTAIAQFHLTGENSIHYNLPEKQQSALERYIGVAGYPTYKIVAPNGNLLPTVAPRPDHPEAIRHIIEEVANSQ